MIKNLLISAFAFTNIFIGIANAQQELGSTYASDEFNTSGNLISVSGSKKLKVIKNEAEGYIEVKFDTLRGGSTDDFLNFQFSTSLNLNNLENRKISFEYECTQSFISWFAFSNVSWGPYSQAQQNKGILIFDLGKEKMSVNFQANDEIKGTFDPSKVSNAYLILNPTFLPPTYKFGETILPGIMKIYNIAIGNSPTLSTNLIQVGNNKQVFFNEENNLISYTNLKIGSELMLYDIMGKLVYSNNISTPSGTFDGSNIKSGLYTIHTLLENQHDIFKLLVK